MVLFKYISMNLLKLTELKRPPNKGSSYLVPCLVFRRTLEDWEKIDNRIYIPVYPNIHTDIESGQPYPHFHVDYRFIRGQDFLFDEYDPILKVYNTLTAPSRINIKDNKKFTIKLIPLRCRDSNHRYGTNPDLIAKTKLAHNCIWKGKCPHRGYDLSNEIPIDGIIICPLHGLKFDVNTKKVINHA